MANTYEWTAIAHSGSKQKDKHIIMVAYNPGMGGVNEVAAVVPMYDLRDMDLSGDVSWTEAAWVAGTKLIDPVYIFRIINSLGAASCVTEAAIKLNDPFLYSQSIRGTLETVYKLRNEILTAVMVKSFISTPIQLGLAKAGLAELGKIGGVANFLIKTACEKAIIESLIRAMRP